MSEKSKKTVEEELVLARILCVMKEKRITAVTLCDALGYKSSQQVTNWKKKDNNSYMKLLPQIATVLGVSVEWLLYGQEESVGELTSEEVKFVRLLRAVPQSARDAVLNMLEFAERELAARDASEADK